MIVVQGKFQDWGCPDGAHFKGKKGGIYFSFKMKENGMVPSSNQ